MCVFGNKFSLSDLRFALFNVPNMLLGVNMNSINIELIHQTKTGNDLCSAFLVYIEINDFG